MNLSKRPTYSSEQIVSYFEHIQLPKKFFLINLSDIRPEDQLQFLTALQMYQMAKVPFENLSLHYSEHHMISLDPHHLYDKIVRQGRGGYCMENNCFFNTVLRTLGFQVFSGGARVSNATNGRDDGGYMGWGHMVNIVTINGKKYHVDVGFGGNGPIHPLPLIDGEISQGIRPQELRLQWTNIPPNIDQSQKLWVFQHRNDSSSPWTSAYCFTELEFLPVDYEIMNLKTSTSRTSFFTYSIICVKTILESDEVIGVMTLVGDEVKRRLKGKSDHLEKCRSEEQRVAALEKHFGIVLGEGEKKGISGMVTEIKT
ncbi:MAG: N-terminal acetyltransferase [Pycnora praestabilis]|nr:MAG: N-terminal acetyltransferase [Pycnora praestabilis]